MADEDRDDYDDEQTPSPAPWYNRTPAVIGASVAGLAVIGILIAAVTFVSGQFNEPEQAPLNFVEPSFSATATRSSSTPTTTATITSTSPPVTTDIDAPTSTTSSSSDTSSSTDTSTRTAWTKPPPGWREDESAPSTTRRGPRTNVTRTLYPQP
jgi:cytoskeletal protein RodZ